MGIMAPPPAVTKPTPSQKQLTAEQGRRVVERPVISKPASNLAEP
jgi:hypothetical protein